MAAVFILIAVRQVGRFRLKIWQIMFGGALAVVIAGQISLFDAFRAINLNVIVFLFGMFVVGEALVQSGYLILVTRHLFSRAKNTDQLVLVLLFGMGIMSAILMNDTLAIIGTPLVLALAASGNIRPRLLLLTLAIAITTGSVMSPIGNPQNLLVAVNSPISSPFIVFARYLVIPTLISLALSYFVLRIVYSRDFSTREISPDLEGPVDADLTRLVKISLGLIIILAGVNIIETLIGKPMILSLPVIALFSAAPILIFSTSRWGVVRKIDWFTLIFFGAMFILMQSVWQSGFFQSFAGAGIASSVPVLLGTSVFISQFISNVPFVALFQPLILNAGGTTAQLMALAAGSTIAGNLTILGAASNVIIIQNAEKQGETFSFMEFFRIGLPLTILQIAVYCAFLSFI